MILVEMNELGIASIISIRVHTYNSSKDLFVAV